MIKLLRDTVFKVAHSRCLYGFGSNRYFGNIFRKNKSHITIETIDVTSEQFQQLVRNPVNSSQIAFRAGLVGFAAWLFYFQMYSGLLPDILLPGCLVAIFLLGKEIRAISRLKTLPRVVAVNGNNKDLVVKSYNLGKDSEVAVNSLKDFRIGTQQTWQNRMLGRLDMKIVYLKNSPYICHAAFLPELSKLSLQK